MFAGRSSVSNLFFSPYRFNFFIQQKCGFRKAPRKVEPRRSDTGRSSEAYKRSALIPPVEETAFYPSPYPIRTLVKPLFFTVGVRAHVTRSYLLAAGVVLKYYLSLFHFS